jgi:hypothetical protein
VYTCQRRESAKKHYSQLERARLSREERLRTEKRIRELLEPEQLAVTEDESNSDDSELEEVHTCQNMCATG